MLCPTHIRVSRLLPLSQLTAKRNARQVKQLFRKELPRYQKDLFKLPELNKHLIEEKYKDEERQIIRQEKLNIYKSYLPPKTSTALIESLFSETNDIDDLLKIIDKNLPAMTSFYLAVSFEALDDMVRLNLCDPVIVLASPEFKKLCTRTLYRLRFFETDEVLKLMKCIVSLRIPEETLITQSCLQMAKNWINDFDVKELKTLESLLNQIDNGKDDETRLLPAIQKSIPLSFKRHPKFLQLSGDEQELLPENEVKKLSNKE